MMRRLHPGIYTLFLALFGLLGFLAHRFPSLPGDNTISQWLQGISLPLFSQTMEVVSSLGETVPMIVTVATIAIVLLSFRRRLEAALIIAMPALAGLLNYSFKLLVDRPRPGDAPLSGGMSFPSGHTTYAIVLGGLIFYLAPRLLKHWGLTLLVQGLAVLFFVLTVLSRVYLGAHQPSDILGSLLLGGLLLTPVIILYERKPRQINVEPEVQDARTA